MAADLKVHSAASAEEPKTILDGIEGIDVGIMGAFNLLLITKGKKIIQ
jgi:hypothetical protein